MGPTERNEDMGLLSDLYIALVPGGAFFEEAEISGAVYWAVGEYGEPVSSTADTAATGPQRVC